MKKLISVLMVLLLLVPLGVQAGAAEPLVFTEAAPHYDVGGTGSSRSVTIAN